MLARSVIVRLSPRVLTQTLLGPRWKCLHIGCGAHQDGAKSEGGAGNRDRAHQRSLSKFGTLFVCSFLIGHNLYSKRKKNYGFSLDRTLALLPLLHAAEPITEGTEENTTEGRGETEKKVSRRAQFNFIADVVAETAPSLVYIEIKDTGVRDYFTGEPVTCSNGSGFIVEADGLILTNAHVVVNKPRASIRVRLADGETYNGRVEDVDVKSDLATVRISASRPLPVMRLGSSNDIRPGEWVVALGSPLSLSNTITTGVISNKARPPNEMGLQGRDVPEYIQTDAAITFGNSGGPLINLEGEAIGINSMKVTPGISFAIPIDYAKEFLKKSKEAALKGWNVTGERRYIGITMITLNHQLIVELHSRIQLPSNITHGILIRKVVEGSPAHLSGLHSADIVTHINSQPIHGTRDLYKLLESQGDLIFTVVRDMKIFNLTVRPEAANA